MQHVIIKLEMIDGCIVSNYILRKDGDTKRNTTYYQIVNNMTEYSMIYSIIIQYDIFRYFIMFHCIVFPCIAMKTYHYIVT